MALKTLKYTFKIIKKPLTKNLNYTHKYLLKKLNEKTIKTILVKRQKLE
jgi:hypothetical protein